MVALLNEGVGNRGLALVVSNAGNTDLLRLNPYGLGFFTEPCSAAQPCGFATRAQLPSSV